MYAKLFATVAVAAFISLANNSVPNNIPFLKHFIFTDNTDAQRTLIILLNLIISFILRPFYSEVASETNISCGERKWSLSSKKPNEGGRMGMWNPDYTRLTVIGGDGQCFRAYSTVQS